MLDSLHLYNHMLIGRNRSYEFAVGQLEASEGKEGRWIGYAIGYTPGGTETMFLFPEISQGELAGITDRIRCIQMTAAIAQNVNGDYGRPDHGDIEWEIERSLRSHPEDFRCDDCQELFCLGQCNDPSRTAADDDFFDDELSENEEPTT